MAISSSPLKSIIVRGAREHNLRNLHVEIPRDKLVVITGPSGSGKSSLAFDTIYAEGQRRYVESLSAYARQFLDQNNKPDVDGIDGLSPAISIEQKSTSKNPRSTVGTLTEIYDYLRLLYARVGTPHCYLCAKPIASQSVQQIVDTILKQPKGTKFQVLAPLVRGRKGEFRREFKQLQAEGFVRVIVNGEVRGLEEEITLDKQKKHDLDLVVDRLVVKKEAKGRITDSVELALKKADGLVKIATMGETKGDKQPTIILYSEHFSCHDCGISYPEIEPRMFSFNSPHGACQNCDGMGHGMEMDLTKIIPDRDKSLSEGAIKPWSGQFAGFYSQQLRGLCDYYKQDIDKPFKKLSKKFQNIILNGSGDKEIEFVYEKERHTFTFKRKFEGIVPHIKRRLRETSSEGAKEKLHRYLTRSPCDSCHGKRLRVESLSIKIAERNITEITAMSVAECVKFFHSLSLNKRDKQIAALILKEINARLSFLEAVGLTYLTLDRTAATLSGGEAQRIRLATQIGSALRGVIYVLDEPSIGLHQRDNSRLLTTLAKLRDLGNTVLVVEHDEETIRLADHVIDMGPLAGVQGGDIVAEGTPQEIAKNKKSLTGAYLSGKLSIPVPKERRSGNGKVLQVKNATGNNLTGVTVDFPLGQLVAVTGVSGSGKSTLVNDTLYNTVARTLNGAETDAAPCDVVTGLKELDKVIEISQSPIGRTPRSNAATYTGLFGLLRDLFAELPESKARGYKPGRFSFNVKGGRCAACEGDGIIKIEMHFLPDVYVTCEHCNGRRYNRETLEVLYKGKSIADLLEMTVAEAAIFLEHIPKIKKKLDTLLSVGLSYIHLGQSATTLSGGEAQRVKLSKELSKRATGRTLYILDEPTTGLHFDDVAKLLKVLHSLVDSGNTVVVIEHNLDVIKTADHIIDLGPEGGSGGGKVLCVGTPEQVAAHQGSFTGDYLRPML